MKITEDIFILSAKRTAFGAFCGALKKHTATDLGVIASLSAIKESHINTKDIEQTIFGNVAQTSSDAIYLARHIGLRSGLPESSSALTLNRLCGSGFQAIISGVEQITTGQANVVLVGGTESMSQAPHIIRGARYGLPLGGGELEDSLWSSLTDSYVKLPMALTAENLAVKYSISQDEVDEYSVRSQKLFAQAQEEGRFDQEITPVSIKQKKHKIDFIKDEHNRPDTTIDSLKKLPKIFKKEGVIHAAAASGICDGASALILASKAFVQKQSLKPIARISGFGISGCDPKIMGIGPVPAILQVLKELESKLDDFDFIEVNEAFAPQVLAVKKELNIPLEKLNVNGGALAIGHPLAASGARITTHLVHELNRRGLRKAIGSACIGGGQGIALAIESV